MNEQVNDDLKNLVKQDTYVEVTEGWGTFSGWLVG